MARVRDGASDFSPKHRIVGAIIVVSLAVIFLPMILSDEPPQPKPGKMASQLSEIPKPDTDTKVLRLPAASLAQATPEIETAAITNEEDGPAEKSDEPAIKRLAKQHQPSASGDAAKVNRPLKDLVREDTAAQASDEQSSAPAEKPVSGDKPKGWFVQVGTFSNNANAKRLRDKLHESGFLVSLEGIDLKGGSAVRVRVGPYRQKHVAMKAQSKIQQQVGLKGVVRAYP